VAGTGLYGDEALRRIAAELINDPHVSCRRLAEAVWGPGTPYWWARDGLRRLRAGVVPAGVDPDLLAAALASRQSRLRRWDRASVVEALRGLAARLGRVPRMRDAGKNGVPDAGTCCRLFGSWNNALRAAGLPVNRNSPAFTWRHPGDSREDAMRALRAAAEQAGGPPSVGLYEELRLSLGRSDWPSVCTLRVLFGSWSAAVEVAGLDGGPRLRLVRAPGVATEAFVRDVVSRVLERGFAVPGDFAGLSSGVASRARAELARRGVPVVVVWRRTAGFLVEAASRGWPEVQGKERGRGYALRLASGETMRAIGESEGLTRERVRQLVREYLACVCGVRQPEAGRRCPERSDCAAAASDRTAART